MLGDEQKALDYQQQALSIFREVGNRRREAHMLTHIGWIYNRLGDYQKALDHLGQALPICRMVGDRRGEATAHQGLGRVYGEWGAGRDFDKSIEHYRQALAIQRAIKSPQDEAQSLLGMARVELERGILTEARESVETALGIIESQRAKISVQDLRASYLATNQDFYEFYIDLLMAMRRNLPPEVAAGYEAAALEANERRLARTLLDSLIEARADIRQGIDPQLIAEERALRQRINAKEAHRIRLLSGERAQDHAAVENELNDMEARYQNIQAQIRASSPHYASLTQPTTLNLRDIQRQTLDDDTLLLEYALGKERSFLWAVTGNSFASYELPRRETIETAAQRFYKLLNVSNQRQYKRESELAAAELGRTLLGPVADQLGKKRLLIVADGALQYVPFAALPTPEAKGKGDGAMGRKEKPRPVAPRVSRPVAFTPLIVNHEIVNLPSASTLAVLRRELVGRQPAARTVAVLADPVLQAGDARVKQSGAGAMIEPGRTPAS
jgi:hypothetical protein